jgi:SAM-dependent methyltransferase
VTPGYDAFAPRYAELVNQRYVVIELSYAFVLDRLGPVTGKRVLDLGSGPGELARRLAAGGAAVTGVDSSREMLGIAEDRVPKGTRLLEEDVQALTTLDNASFDAVAASLMLMDVPDFQAVFRAAARVLVPMGTMVWTITHPCFQSPHSEPIDDGTGVLGHRRIKEYSPTWWRSDRPGTVRGELGAYHRPLSDYMNAFIASGFDLISVAEPVAPSGEDLQPDQVSHRTLPPILGVEGRRKP